MLGPLGGQSFLDTSDVFRSVSELSPASSAGQGGVKMGSARASCNGTDVCVRCACVTRLFGRFPRLGLSSPSLPLAAGKSLRPV